MMSGHARAVVRKKGMGESGKGNGVAQTCFAEKPQAQVEAVEDETRENTS